MNTFKERLRGEDKLNVGRRVGKLREAHGESLRAAAIRTGVSHTTIARIEKGDVVGSFQSTLRKIADGYGVRVEFLLGGRDPRRDFDFILHQLSPEERSRLHFLPPRVRIQMVLRFMLTEYPDELSLDRLAASSGIPKEMLAALVTETASTGLARQLEVQLAKTLEQMTGIPQHWFVRGAGGAEDSDMMSAEMVSAFASLMKKAATANINPSILDMVIELLIMKSETKRPADP